MHGAEGPEHVSREPDRVRRGHGALREERREAPTLEELHHHEGEVAVFAYVEHVHHVPVVDRGHEAGLAEEALALLRVLTFALEELHGHGPAQAPVLGAPDDGHPALTEGFLQDVARVEHPAGAKVLRTRRRLASPLLHRGVHGSRRPGGRDGRMGGEGATLRPVRELVWVLALVSGLWAVGAAVQLFATDAAALRTAWIALMVLGSLAIVAELAYFALLGVGLGRSGTRPPRWYARSFEHHALLERRWTRATLPFFWLGFVLLLVSLGLALLLGLAAFLGLRAGT